METDDVEVVSPRGSSKRKGRPSDICSDDSSEDEIRPQGKQRRKAAIDVPSQSKVLIFAQGVVCACVIEVG